MMNDMKNFCMKHGVGLTFCAEYLGDDVRVTEWKKNGKKEREKRK